MQKFGFVKILKMQLNFHTNCCKVFSVCEDRQIEGQAVSAVQHWNWYINRSIDMLLIWSIVLLLYCSTVLLIYSSLDILLNWSLFYCHILNWLNLWSHQVYGTRFGCFRLDAEKGVCTSADYRQTYRDLKLTVYDYKDYSVTI